MEKTNKNEYLMKIKEKLEKKIKNNNNDLEINKNNAEAIKLDKLNSIIMDNTTNKDNKDNNDKNNNNKDNDKIKNKVNDTDTKQRNNQIFKAGYLGSFLKGIKKITKKIPNNNFNNNTSKSNSMKTASDLDIPIYIRKKGPNYLNAIVPPTFILTKKLKGILK